MQSIADDALEFRRDLGIMEDKISVETKDVSFLLKLWEIIWDFQISETVTDNRTEIMLCEQRYDRQIQEIQNK